MKGQFIFFELRPKTAAVPEVKETKRSKKEVKRVLPGKQDKQWVKWAKGLGGRWKPGQAAPIVEDLPKPTPAPEYSI